MKTQEQTDLTTYSDRIMKTLYSTKVTATGGRHGHIRSEDGLLDMKLALPRQLGGKGDATNPETLFAGGYAACSILSLRSSAIEESGLTTTLQRLVEQSNIAGLLRCDFRSDDIPEERLPPRIQHELLRFAQEAISNAVRHAKPTVVSVTLRWDPPNLILKVKDNGSGISSASLEKSEGFGLSNMRTRASHIDGKLDIQTAAGRGTSIVLTVPIP